MALIKSKHFWLEINNKLKTACISFQDKLYYAFEMAHRHVEELYQKDITEMTQLTDAIRKVRDDLSYMNNEMLSTGFFIKRELFDLFNRKALVQVWKQYISALILCLKAVNIWRI